MMQCKDIPDEDVLKFLYKHRDGWCYMFSPDLSDRSIFLSMPHGVSRHLALAKMRKLIKRGLVSGCDCGCRGDFEITDKGIERLGLEGYR